VTPIISNGTGELLALGDYTVTFVPTTERELEARFVDTGGPLEVSGTVKVDAGRVYTLDALIEARPSASEALVQGLDFTTAEPDAEGRRRLTLTGSL
jgi:Type II secretion system (T2SS), protein N